MAGQLSPEFDTEVTLVAEDGRKSTIDERTLYCTPPPLAASTVARNERPVKTTLPNNMQGSFLEVSEPNVSPMFQLSSQGNVDLIKFSASSLEKGDSTTQNQPGGAKNSVLGTDSVQARGNEISQRGLQKWDQRNSLGDDGRTTGLHNHGPRDNNQSQPKDDHEKWEYSLQNGHQEAKRSSQEPIEQERAQSNSEVLEDGDTGSRKVDLSQVQNVADLLGNLNTSVRSSLGILSLDAIPDFSSGIIHMDEEFPEMLQYQNDDNRESWGKVDAMFLRASPRLPEGGDGEEDGPESRARLSQMSDIFTGQATSQGIPADTRHRGSGIDTQSSGSEMDTEDELQAVRESAKRHLYQRKHPHGDGQDSGNGRSSRPGLEGGSTDDEVDTATRMDTRQAAEGDVVTSPVPGDGGGGGDGSSGSEMDTPLSGSSHSAAALSGQGQTTSDFLRGLGLFNQQRRSRSFEEDDPTAQARIRPMGDDLLSEISHHQQTVRFQSQDQVWMMSDASHNQHSQDEDMSEESRLASQFLQPEGGGDGRSSATSMLSQGTTLPLEQSSFHPADLLPGGLRSAASTLTHSQEAALEQSSFHPADYLPGLRSGVSTLTHNQGEAGLDQSSFHTGDVIAGMSDDSDRQQRGSSRQSDLSRPSPTQHHFYNEEGEGQPAVSPHEYKQKGEIQPGGAKGNNPSAGENVFEDGDETMADSVVHISFTEEELNGLDGFDGLMDSFDDGEFFSGDNAQAILDDDEAAFEEEHKFDEVADNVADHTPHVADSSWMLPHGDVTFSAMVSHDGRDRSHDQSHGKVSFGQFIGTRTEALGTLEGDGLVPRPTFGTDFVTPPSDRKPVALLADIEERDSEQDVSIKENRIPHLDLNDSREMLGATEGIQTAYFKPAAAKTNKSVTAEETDGDQTLTASPSPPRLQQQGPIAGSPLTKLGTYSKSGVDRTLTESLSSSKGLRDSNIVAMTENRQSPLWKMERLTGERLQTQTTVFGQEKSRDGHNVRMETSSKLPQVSDGVGSPKGGGTPTRSAIPRLVQQSGAAKKSVGDTTNSRSRNMGQAGGKITPDHRDSYPVKQKEENSRVLAGSSSPSRIDDKPKTSVSCTKKPEKNYNSHAEQSMKNYHNYSVSKSSEPGSKVTLVPSDKRPTSPRRYQQDDHRKMAGKSRILEKDSVMSSSESDSTGREERQKKQYSSPRRHKVALESPRVKKTQFAIGSSSSSVNSTEEQNNGSSPDTDNDNVSTVSETDSFHDSQSDAESVHSILEEVSMRVQPGAGIPDETTFLDQTGAVNISAISKYIASLSMSAPMDDIAEKVLKLSHKQRQEKPKPQMRQTESRPPPPGVNRDTAPPGVHKMSKGQAVKMERQTPPVNVVEFSKPSQSSVRDRKGTPVSSDASSVYSTSSTSMGYYNERGSRPPPPGDTTGQHHNVPSSSQGSSSAGTLVSKPSVAPTREVRTPPVGVTSEQDGPATTRSLQLERPSQSRGTTSKNTSLSEKSFQHDNKQKGPLPVTGRSPPGVSFKRSSQEVSERSPPGFRSGRSLAETNGRSPPGISTGHLGSPTGVSTGRSPTGVSTGGSPTGLSTRESPLLRTSTDYSSNERKTSPKPGSLETSSSPSLSPRQDHATFKENNVIHGGRREPKISSETYDTYTIPSSVVKQLDYREREPPSGIFSDTGDKAPLMSQDFAETASQATSIWGSIEEYERRGKESPPYNQTRDSHSTVSTSSVNSSLDRQREGSSRHPHGMAAIPLPTSQAFGTEHGRSDSSSTSSVLRSSTDQQYRSHPQGGSSVHSWQPQASVDANRPAFTMNSQTPGISHMRETTWGSENLQYTDSRQAMSIPADFRPQARSEPVGVSSIPPVSALFQENAAQTFVTPSSMHNLFATTTVPSGYQVPRDRQAQSYLSSTYGYQLPPSIHTPGELRLPGVCCVGLSSRTELTLHNPTDRWVQCGLELTSITVNGQVLDTVLNNPFVFKKLKVIVEPRTTERIALVFAPKYPGVYVGQLNIVTSPVVSDQPLQTSGLPSMVTIQAMAEEPNIQVKTGSEFGLDFGQLPYGSQKSLPLTVVNNGKAAVPLRLVISTNKSSWHCFTFDSEQASPDVSVISQTHRPVTPALARSIINLTIPGSGEHGHPTETHVPLFFRAPKQSFDRDHVPETPEVLTATVVIEVDMPKSVAAVRSVSVRATVGVARLHAPRSLDSVVLQAAVGWSDTKLLPLRNAGNITLDVTLSIHDWPQLFTVFPTRLQLAPGMGEDVVVKYKAVDQQQRTYESALHMLVEPDGPAYETPLRGLTQSVTSRQTVSAPPSDHFSAQPIQQGFQQTDTGFSRGQDGHLPAEMTYPSREQMNNLQTTVFRQSDTGQSNMVQDSIPTEKVRSKASSASAGHPPQTLLCNKHFLSWGGVPVGRSLHQKTTLCNASDEMIKLRLRIKGCTPDFQLQVGSGDSERRCDERELILKPKEEYPVNVLFCPTRVAAFNTKLEIRPLTGRIKYPVPLYGYGGVSKLVLHGVKQGQGSAGSWASLGDMSGCSHCVTQVQLKNTGVRAAYVKALCFTDITCRQQLPVNKISVQPNECIIFPEEEKTVVIAFHPTERERILCSDNPSSVGAIGFFYGDEVSRKLFRASKGRSKQLAAENPLCQVNFDVQYDGQDDINEDLGTATVPNAADLFYSTMSRIMLTLVGEPTPKMVARPDSIRDSLMPLMADESVADSTVANLDISFPVKGTPLVSRQKLTTDVNTWENWSINPPQLILETSRDTRGSHMKRVQLINYYDRPLRYELAWPDHCVKVTPQQGTVEPRTSVLVCVSASPTLYSRGIPLPWSGAVHISCDDGKTQTLRIQIRESLELPGPTEHTTEQHPFLKPPDILPQSVRMIFTPQQSSAANTGLQLIGPAIKTVTPIGSLPVASSSTSSPPRVTASQVVNFPDTCVGRTAETELTLRNTKDESVTWVLSSLAPPYIKGVSGSVEILRVKYAVFKLMKKSGVLEAQQQAVIPIQFSPREAGQYSQHWEVHTKPHSSLSTAAGLQSLRVQMFGEGTPASSAGSEEKENRPLVNNSDKPISMRTVEDSTLPCPPEEAVATLTLKSDHLTFPATTAGSCAIQKARVKNGTTSNHTVEVIPPQPPFHVKHHNLKAKSRHYISLPVEFRPTSPGSYKSLVVLRVDTGHSLSLQVYGECV